MNHSIHNALIMDDLPVFRRLWTLEEEENSKQYRGWGFVHYAVCNGNLECLRYILESGACPNTRTENERNTPLGLSFAYHVGKHIRILLLKHGGNPFLRNVRELDAYDIAQRDSIDFYYLDAYLVVELVCGEADNLPLDLWRVVKHYIL